MPLNLFLACLLWLGLPAKYCIEAKLRVSILSCWYIRELIEKAFSVWFVSCGFFICTLSCCGHSFLLLVSWVFLLEGCWTLQTAFSSSIDMIMCIFVLPSIIVLCYIDWFSYVETPLHSWTISHFFMVYNPITMLLYSTF